MNFDVKNIKEELLKLDNTPDNLEIKKNITNLMSKNKINWENLSVLMQDTTLYFDYDEVIADLIEPWVEYINNANNTNFSSSDVDSWDWFSKQPNGMDFLSKNPDTYENVEVKKGIFELFLELGKNDMMRNVTIVTATHPSTYLSKMKHFEEKIQTPMQELFHKELGRDFPLTFVDSFVTTNSKWKLDFNNAVLIDDGAHNASAVVNKNVYAYVMLLDYKHNTHLQTGKRIKRLNNFDDFFITLLQTALESYDRRSDLSKAHLLEKARKPKLSDKNEKQIASTENKIKKNKEK